MRNVSFFALALGLLFLVACQNDGIQTEHGFRFVSHTSKGGTKPQPGETVIVNAYTFIGDSMISSTVKNYGGPQEYNLMTKDKLPKRVPALYDAVLLMGEGDSATIYQTIDTFLRKYIPPTMKDAKEVRYEISLVDVVTQAEKDKSKAEADALLEGVKSKAESTVQSYASGKLAGLTTTGSGLKVLIEDKGSGAAVNKGEKVKVHYYGCLADGTMFDNSYQRGEPYEFPAGVGQMIKGFDEGVMLLNHGGKGFFFIPSSLGYGDSANGPIPAKAELIFFVEVL
ncbi:MAG: FKBP-type peptidyl-prolyl cis-trans isomerase [Saprospiraceae bacterium]|nr:FKBP-type peptidyl-prolyl cis-trans isomerase [Saprospiraceae bacterium]